MCEKFQLDLEAISDHLGQLQNHAKDKIVRAFLKEFYHSREFFVLLRLNFYTYPSPFIV